MDKDKLIVAQNCNSATAQIMAALVGAGSFSYEDVRANWGDMHGIVNANTFTAAAAQMVAAARGSGATNPTTTPRSPAGGSYAALSATSEYPTQVQLD